MSMLREYLAQTERKYHYRVKTVVALDDETMDRIEGVIAKYLPLDISVVEKSIFQRHPMDFPGIENREVYWVDITLGLPASAYILQQDIRAALSIPEKFIVVRMDNEPTEVETQRINAVADMEIEATKDGYERDALLNQGKEYPEAVEVEATDLYGDVYNGRLLDYLKKLEDERQTAIAAANAPKPFDYLKNELSPEQDTSDFNAGVKGAPAASSTHKHGMPVGQTTAAAGNLDGNEQTYKRLYRTKGGEKKVLSKTGIAVKKKG